MRRTNTLIKVADALMEEPHERHWGYELLRRANIRSGVMYPILGRLLDYGWLEDGWEDREEISEKRPPRRYYKLTPEGELALTRLLADAPADVSLRQLAGRPA
jgi:PadR family transcriptional regulator, regulatory protein PadR